MSGRARGGWSEVWALHVAINGPRGFDLYTAKNLIPIRGRKRARYGMELQYRYVQLGQSHCIFCMGSALQLESTCNPSVGSRP